MNAETKKYHTLRRSPTKRNFDITRLDVILLTRRSPPSGRDIGRNGQISVLPTNQEISPAGNATHALQQDLVATAMLVTDASRNF
jgi:hypothetical protein